MSRTIKKPIERRSEIVQAARYLFRTKDYENTTMQDVMAYLGIAKGTIYHYFNSKEALLEAVIENIVNTNIERMEYLMRISTGTALEKIKMLVEAGDIRSENEDILDSLHRPGNDAMHVRLLAATLIKQAPLYAQLIQQGCAEGVFQTQAPLECAEFILSGIQFLTDVGIYPWTQEDLMRRARAFPILIEQQLKAPAGSFHFIIDRAKVN